MDIELIDQVDNHIKYGIIYTHDDVKDCLEQEAQVAQPEVKANGFRPGKVPIDYILRMYGEKLRIQAMNKKVTGDITAIIEENKYNLASQPVYNFKPRQETGDNNFYVELELFVMPTLPEMSLETLKITQYEPNEEAFQQILDKNLLMFQIMTADFENIEDIASEENDKILFNIEVTVDGEEMGALGGQMQAILGQEQAPPEIEAQLKGKKSGEEVIYTHQYAADEKDLFAPFLAGTEAVYKIKIDKIERPIIKELDEDKIQKIGFRDYDHLFEVLEGNTRETLKNISFSKMRHEFLENLRTSYQDIAIPDFMIDQEAHHLAIAEISANSDVDVMAEITAGKMQLNISDIHREKAKHNVRIGLFIRDYVKQNDITVSDVEIKNELEKHLQELERLNSIKPDQKEQNYRDLALKARTIVLELKVLRSVLSRVDLKEEHVSKDDFFEKIKLPN